MENFLTLREAGKKTGYNPDYLSFLIRNKKLPAKRIGRAWCVTEEALKKFIKEKNFPVSSIKAERQSKLLPARVVAFHWAAFAAIFVVSLICVRVILWPALNSYLFEKNIVSASDDSKIYTASQSVVTYYSDVSSEGIHPTGSEVSDKK